MAYTYKRHVYDKIFVLILLMFSITIHIINSQRLKKNSKWKRIKTNAYGAFIPAGSNNSNDTAFVPGGSNYNSNSNNNTANVSVSIYMYKYIWIYTQPLIYIDDM